MRLLSLTRREAGLAGNPEVLAYLLDLTKDRVGGLDLPFAQLPQGHLLKVNLGRQGT